MPIESFKTVPKNTAEWDRFFRSTPVVPSNESVDSNVLQNGAVSEPKLADNAVSTRTVALNAINNQRLRDSDPCSVIGRSAGTSGDPADILFASDGQFLVRRSGVLQAGGIVDTDLPATIARDSEVAAAVAAHEAASDPHTAYQRESEKDAVSGYAGLNSVSRTTKGVDTTDDIIIDLATKGLVLKDTQGTPHYWRVTVSTLGVLTSTDLGTTKP